uniref:Adhesion G protein-coupled receptor E8 n=1 Tax=Salarias fasciatus TaxID=181472 RepID=A0A672FQJ0_SALFA
TTEISCEANCGCCFHSVIFKFIHRKLFFSDVDECLESTVCGPDSVCTNTPGTYSCACEVGYVLMNPNEDFSESNICIDVDECAENATLCGPNSNCENLDGSFLCICFPGFRESKQGVIASATNPCTGAQLCLEYILVILQLSAVCGWHVSQKCVCVCVYIDECSEDPDVCGKKSVCTNAESTFYCSCTDGFYPSTGILWETGISICKSQKSHVELIHNIIFIFLKSLLSHKYLRTENRTEMYSNVFTAMLPINNTNLTEPVNFTIQHKKQDFEEKEEKAMRWSVEGCWVLYSDENCTVCSCSHLSTFALIIHISADAQFQYTASVSPQLVCSVMAGLLHFLVVASFVWMQLEALQLYLLVRRLSKVQVIQRDGLPKLLLYLIGYGVPFVIVGVSALVYSDGYGATEAEACWLSRQRNFNWALTGPVITILGVSLLHISKKIQYDYMSNLYDVSQSKDTRYELIIFKILAQFVILGCTWILGLYQTNLFFQVLFIILNSQQGTFLFIVHCLLNKEVTPGSGPMKTSLIKDNTDITHTF